MDIALIFASLIFLCFLIFFWRFGNDPIRSFAVRQRFEVDDLDVEAKKFRDAFLKDFDGYLVSINDRNRFRYRVASGAFFIAALISILLSIPRG